MSIEIKEYFIFKQDGTLAFTTNDAHCHEADIEARNLIIMGSYENIDLDYTYTLEGSGEDAVIKKEHTPVQAPPAL